MVTLGGSRGGFKCRSRTVTLPVYDNRTYRRRFVTQRREATTLRERPSRRTSGRSTVVASEQHLGVWLSPVERFPRTEEARGSNPLTSTSRATGQRSPGGAAADARPDDRSNKRP